jgi:phosphatidate cytidylyltransferase
MALNIDTLKTRSLTALIFVAVMLVGLLWNFWSFVILFTIIHFGCCYEYVKLIKKIYGKNVLYFLLGLFYITMPILMMIDLWYKPMVYKGDFPLIIFSYIFPIAIIFSIWVNDTIAYIVGSLIGKTPLSKISPKKTWEGTIGGMVLAVIVVGFLFPLIMQNQLYFCGYKKIIWFIIAALCAIFGTLGDLFESKLKRMANVKDSGSFMPGHGGFLDRFDSLLFAVPAVWIYIKLCL